MEPEADDAVGMVAPEEYVGATFASVGDAPGGGLVGIGGIVEDSLDMVIGTG